jgi:hypothetical protein
MPLSRSWHLQGILLLLDWWPPSVKHVQLHPRFDYDTHIIYVHIYKWVYNLYAYIYKVNVCIMLSPIHTPCAIHLQFPTPKWVATLRFPVD